jgi:hypothetical protein
MPRKSVRLGGVSGSVVLYVRLRYLLINLLITQVQSRKLVTIIYLDNILVSLKIEEEYIDYIKEVLDRLKELRLYIRLNKYR